MNKGFVAGTPNWVKPLITQAVEKYGGSTLQISAQMLQESGFRPGVSSHAGAAGIAQFMPATGRAYGLRVDGRVDERLDPRKAIPAMVRHMADLQKQHGSWNLALAAYNAGSGNVRKYGGIPPFTETQNYVRNIQGMTGQSGLRTSAQPIQKQNLLPSQYRPVLLAQDKQPIQPYETKIEASMAPIQATQPTQAFRPASLSPLPDSPISQVNYQSPLAQLTLPNTTTTYGRIVAPNLI